MNSLPRSAYIGLFLTRHNNLVNDDQMSSHGDSMSHPLYSLSFDDVTIDRAMHNEPGNCEQSIWKVIHLVLILSTFVFTTARVRKKDWYNKY